MDMLNSKQNADTSTQNKNEAEKPPFAVRFGGRIGCVLDESGFTLCFCKKLFNKTLILDIKKHTFDSDEPANLSSHIDTIIGEIQKYRNLYKTGNIPVNIGLLRHDVAFRRMFLPKMPAVELNQAVMWEGEKLFPFPFSESIVYFETVVKILRGETPFVGINIVAAKSFIIEELFSKLTSAKIKIGQINFLPCILSSIISSSDIKNYGERQILLHLDDSNTSMALFIHNGKLEFYQEFVTTPFLDENVDVGISNLEALTAELQSFQDLYIAQSRISEIKNIIITGPLAENQKLQSHINTITGIPCVNIAHIDSYKSLFKDNKLRQNSNYLPVIQTACVSPDIHPLIPETVLKKINQNKFIRRVSTAAVLTILLVASLHLVNLRTEEYLLSKLDAKKTDVLAYEQSEAYQGYLNLAGKLRRGKSYLRLTETKQDSHFNIILKTLSRDLPKELNLTDIYFKNQEEGLRLRLVGHVKIGDFSPEIILAQYVESLRKLPFLRNIEVTNHHKQRKNDKFDLQFQINMDTQV
ncbi:MAG: hypothetical protein KAR42_09730 [candidate division Zixibacteria bacterium]|nr:hypothetical protein [candidate division Zixibacteria bacterium]